MIPALHQKCTLWHLQNAQGGKICLVLAKVIITHVISNFMPFCSLNNAQAYEEKEKLWEKELRKIKGLYDNRLRASQQKSSKMEQALTNQTYQVREHDHCILKFEF